VASPGLVHEARPHWAKLAVRQLEGVAVA